MSNKRSYQKQLRVQMNYVPAPDVRERLSRVLSILLKAATRHTATLGGSMNAKKQQPPCQAPTQDASVDGGDSNV